MTASSLHLFTDRYFIVTGSTQGLGAAVARLLAERGAKGLILCGRNAGRGEAQALALQKEFGCNAHFVAANLEQVDDCRAVVAAAERRFGTVHGLANCAGMSDRGTILDTSPERFDALFAVNVRAPFFLMQDTIALMIRNDVEGAIVNIQSMCAHGGQPFLTAYSASKGALATMTRSVAFAAMRNRIRVNGLNIGWMNTPHEDEIQRQYHGASDGWLEAAMASQPFGRLLEPAEVARSVAFLLSDESGMMTGSVVDLDQSVIGCNDSGPDRPANKLSLG